MQTAPEQGKGVRSGGAVFTLKHWERERNGAARGQTPSKAQKPRWRLEEKEEAKWGAQSALFCFVKFDQIEDMEETVRIKVSKGHGYAVGLVAPDHALGDGFHPAGGAGQADFDGARRLQWQPDLGYEIKAVEADVVGIDL